MRPLAILVAAALTLIAPALLRGRDGGRVYATAANLLSLEACRRVALLVK